MQYLIDLARDVVRLYDRVEGNVYFEAFVEELDRLNPLDFVAVTRSAFIRARAELRYLLRHGMLRTEVPYGEELERAVDQFSETLEGYGGGGSRVAGREFWFVDDKALRTIIERDYRELRAFVFPSGAWKSTVVLAGSILEAVLLDQVSRRADKARECASADSRKDLGSWGLAALIGVAGELGVLDDERAGSVDHVLRDYRNFIHPAREVRAKHACAEGQALMAVGALEAICDALPPSDCSETGGNGNADPD